jgi:hypothetical protein
MALTISISVTPVGAPSIVSPSDVHAAATRFASPFGARAVAVTGPALQVDTTHVSFATRATRAAQEFRFDTGTLTITLHQQILVSNALAECPRTKWLEHEQDHARDNERVASRLEAPLRADAAFSALFDETVWRPQSTFHSYQLQIIDAVQAVFRPLTAAAVAARDTSAEYARVEARIAAECH